MTGVKAVITGCGVVAPNGIGRAAFADAVRNKRSGIADLVGFDASGTGRARAAEVTDFSPDAYLRSPKNYLDRNSALAFAACEMAVRESGIALPAPERGCGIAVGTMSGNMESLGAFHAKLREKGPKFAPPFLFPHTYYNTTAGLLSIEYGLNGPHNQFCSGAAAGLEAIAWAAECVALGRAPAMIAGGVEAFSEPLFRSALARGWLSPLDGGGESCRPFAPDRNGTIVGEGAAFFVIESEKSARGRGAALLASVEGIGIAPGPETAMRRAMEAAECPPDSVSTVFAAAGGYPDSDPAEESAIEKLFGASKVKMEALKSLIGETLAASGPLSLAAALSSADDRRLLVNAGAPSGSQWLSLLTIVRK